MSVPRAPLEPSAIPARNSGQRRAYIRQFIQQLGGEYANQVLEERLASKQMIIDMLADRGVRQAGAAWFEYNIDKTAWINLFRYLGDQAPAWPWSTGPKLSDMSDGMSQVYNQWRKDRKLPVDMPDQKAAISSGKGKTAEKTPEITEPAAPKAQTRNGESSKAQVSGGESSQSKVWVNRKWARLPHRLQGAAPVPQDAPKDLPQETQTLYENLSKEFCAALPEIESEVAPVVPPTVRPQVALPVEPRSEPLDAKERIENPVVLDKGLREWFWERCSGGQCIGVVAGPFVLNLPVWLDFERLVVGEDGRDIDAINNDILEPGVAISWEVYGGKPLCLVVGFKDEASSMLPEAQQHLFEVWCDVVAWFCSAVSGSPVSLAPYLRAIQVVSPCLERTPDLGDAQSVWQQALDNRDLFASRARQARECFELWSPMIRQVIEQPLGVAEHNLATWIWSIDADSDERFKRLNVAREVWLSSSSDPKVICRATKWVQSFIATLQPSA